MVSTAHDKLRGQPVGRAWARAIALLQQRVDFLEQRQRDGLASSWRLAELGNLKRVVKMLATLVPVALDLEHDLAAERSPHHERLLGALRRAGIVDPPPQEKANDQQTEGAA